MGGDPWCWAGVSIVVAAWTLLVIAWMFRHRQWGDRGGPPNAGMPLDITFPLSRRVHFPPPLYCICFRLLDGFPFRSWRRHATRWPRSATPTNKQHFVPPTRLRKSTEQAKLQFSTRKNPLESVLESPAYSLTGLIQEYSRSYGIN